MKTACFVLAVGAAVGACACSSNSSSNAQNQSPGSKDSGSQNEGPCGSLPALDDYSTPGPFADTTTTDGSGPDGKYTLIVPTNLGVGPDGKAFKHPIITWGNGITTTPKLYPGLLSGIASHGFVIIASDSTTVSAALMTAGLDWMIQQNDPGGQFEGKLNTKCLATVGYSLGGNGAVTSASHADVLATVVFHNLKADAANVNGPLFLITSTADGFVPKETNVQPTYDSSPKEPTVMATWDPMQPKDNVGHLTPLGDAGVERAPAIAWLRHWIYGDTGAKKYFYGADCILCQTPWVDIQRKNAQW